MAFKKLHGQKLDAHVEASNTKPIDRSIRLIVELDGVDYETACIALSFSHFLVFLLSCKPTDGIFAAILAYTL